MPINNALIVDVETTGPDASATMIEVGLILYSLEFGILNQFSTVFASKDFENPVEHINHISPGTMVAANQSWQTVAPSGIISDMRNGAGILVAHNADFDKQFFDGNGKTWLCTMTDFDWPIPSTSQSLASICLAHGIPVWKQHRALTDCIYIADLFDKMGEKLPEMFEQAMKPRAMFAANVSFDQKELAKTAGFHWESARRLWLKKLPIDEPGQFPFTIRRA